MTRIEFSEMLVAAKENSGITTTELSFAMKLLFQDLRRIERGLNNYNMGKVLSYACAINHYISLAKKGRPTTINTYPAIVAWLIKMREKNTVSQLTLAKAIGCSRDTIAKAEAQKITMSIDTFLSIAGYFGYEIQIKPNTNEQ